MVLLILLSSVIATPRVVALEVGFGEAEIRGRAELVSCAPRASEAPAATLERCDADAGVVLTIERGMVRASLIDRDGRIRLSLDEPADDPPVPPRALLDAIAALPARERITSKPEPPATAVAAPPEGDAPEDPPAAPTPVEATGSSRAPLWITGTIVGGALGAGAIGLAITQELTRGDANADGVERERAEVIAQRAWVIGAIALVVAGASALAWSLD